MVIQSTYMISFIQIYLGGTMRYSIRLARNMLRIAQSSSQLLAKC